MGLPAVLTTQLLMVYRYISVLLQESLSMSRARAIVLDHSRVVADGPTSALLANRQLMQSTGMDIPASLLAYLRSLVPCIEG